MNSRQFSILIVFLLLVMGSGFYYVKYNVSLTSSEAPITSFEECVAVGNPILESYQRRCETILGKIFTENLGTSVENQNLVRVSNPLPNEEVTSPLRVYGEARGLWFFEASFPVKLLDGNGKEITRGIAEAQGEWMTENFVPFKVVLVFTPPSTLTGTLILEKDNPSGDPERNDSFRLPIRFKTIAGGVPKENTEAGVFDGCVISGCSSEVCGNEAVISACEYRSAYACYRNARCEKQSNGRCGWTETGELRQCLLETQ